MEIEFNHIGIKCSDQEAAVKFYTEVLGMEKLFEVEILGRRCIFVGRGPLQIELEEVKTEVEPPQAPPDAGLYHIAFKVEGIEQVAEELKERGAEFLMPPFQIRPTRKTAFVKAPDAVLVQLVEDTPEQ